jgi:hypothetical protein
MFKLGIQQSDNVVINDWCSCCSDEEEECSPRFFVLEVPVGRPGHRTWAKVSCYSSGDSDYAVGTSYYKRTFELKRI